MDELTEKQEESLDEEAKTPSGSPVQNWIQAQTYRFDTHEEARAKFDSLDAERKRIRYRRATGHFDVVVYEALAKPETKKAKKRKKNRGSQDQESLR